MYIRFEASEGRMLQLEGDVNSRDEAGDVTSRDEAGKKYDYYLRLRMVLGRYQAWLVGDVAET